LVAIATEGGPLYKSRISRQSCLVHFFLGKFKINVNLILNIVHNDDANGGMQHNPSLFLLHMKCTHQQNSTKWQAG
jgi:hypothetical protein